MNEDNISLPSYSDLADKIKTLNIENNILKDQLKFWSSGTTNLHGKNIETDAKTKFFTETASVV